MRFFAVLAASFAALAVAAPAFAGTAYYVSASGSDSAAGDAAHPWRTVARVNGAALAAGDTVLFEGGASFGGTLQPAGSGAAGAPITFTSYGSGRANILGGISIGSRSWLTF